MVVPVKKPSGSAPKGRLDNPIYARTSVLCNGQIVWKVRGEQDLTYSATDPQRADLRYPIDATDNLNALNGLQLYRSKPLAPLELKQPLRHVQSSLPKAVKSAIYTGDLYGSLGGVFSCLNEDFDTTVSNVFGNEVRGDGNLNYNDFFRRLRRSEWLLWDVEAEKGHWVVVVAHLYKSIIGNSKKRNFPDNANIPATTQSSDFNAIDAWCIVSPENGKHGDALVKRVETRLPAVLVEGGIRFDVDSERIASIWVPTDKSNWASGLHVYNIIKTLMHRLTEFHCRETAYDESFWDPLPGWLNVDEVRAEMQGRAAQRCMASTGYRSRIAIEGVRRYIGWKEVVRANELRPRHRDNIAYRTGLYGKDGHGIPVSKKWSKSGDKTALSDDEDDGKDKFSPTSDDDDVSGRGFRYEDEINIAGGPVGPPPSHVYGWHPSEDSEDDLPRARNLPLGKIAELKKLGIELDLSDVPKNESHGYQTYTEHVDSTQQEA
ncbi:hypothetical protein F5B22DRAFT_402141 [Xylaria bambusicola]|uniref:uncharacterized protein n=1 Tax=Xylaria bambusicola TaxID=326684 RepID=UPI00200751C9|nr:uncharacterized protein F5B22DRAFT_402141 [Xylaria bambusicola]KAI0508360.1 hypothetical protein F5B22DRAFT_402141 [Xylaria bambusicola]